MEKNLQEKQNGDSLAQGESKTTEIKEKINERFAGVLLSQKSEEIRNKRRPQSGKGI